VEDRPGRIGHAKSRHRFASHWCRPNWGSRDSRYYQGGAIPAWRGLKLQDQLKKESEANTKRTYSYIEAHKREKEQLEKEHAAAMEACKKDYRVVYDRLSQQLTLDKENLQKEYAALKIEIITSKSTAAAIQNGDSASAQNSELQQLKSQIQEEIEKVTLLNSELEFFKKQVIQRETDILQLNNEVSGLQENAQLLQQAKVNIDLKQS
jgi:hypothetical protein